MRGHAPSLATQENRLRDLDPMDIDKLVMIKGMVTRVTPVIPDMKVGGSRRSATKRPRVALYCAVTRVAGRRLSSNARFARHPTRSRPTKATSRSPSRARTHHVRPRTQCASCTTALALRTSRSSASRRCTHSRCRRLLLANVTFATPPVRRRRLSTSQRARRRTRSRCARWTACMAPAALSASLAARMAQCLSSGVTRRLRPFCPQVGRAGRCRQTGRPR